MDETELDTVTALIEAVDQDFGTNAGDSSPESPSTIDLEIPIGLVDYVKSICRAPWAAERVLDRATAKVLRRLRHDTGEARTARWAKRWQPEEQANTKRWLGRLRDEVLYQAHLGEVAQHTTFATVPGSLQSWQPDRLGRLIVDDTDLVNPSLGVPSYLEQTPPKLLRWVHETWQRDHLREVEDVSLDDSPEPKIWDLTAGSGTSIDYFANIDGARLVASDLTVGPEDVAMADCRDVGALGQHRGVSRRALAKPDFVIRQPDIILFDPPSRGCPTHAELYHGPFPRLDLGLLSREEWLAAIAFTVIEATRHLSRGGLVSLLLRYGTRSHGHVEADLSLLDDLKSILSDHVEITHEMPIVFRSRRNQVSLGKSRVPAVHLQIERAP